MKLVPELVTGPTAEPLTLAEAKKQVEISSTDTAHDNQLQMLIEDARQQWERTPIAFAVSRHTKFACERFTMN